MMLSKRSSIIEGHAEKGSADVDTCQDDSAKGQGRGYRSQMNGFKGKCRNPGDALVRSILELVEC